MAFFIGRSRSCSVCAGGGSAGGDSAGGGSAGGGGSALAPCTLAIWQPGSVAVWEPAALDVWQSGSLAFSSPYYKEEADSSSIEGRDIVSLSLSPQYRGEVLLLYR